MHAVGDVIAALSLVQLDSFMSIYDLLMCRVQAVVTCLWSVFSWTKSVFENYLSWKYVTKHFVQIFSYVQCCVTYRIVDKFWVTGSLLNWTKIQKFRTLTKGRLGWHWQSIYCLRKRMWTDFINCNFGFVDVSWCKFVAW